MFETRSSHNCTIADRTSRSFLPPLPPEAGKYQRLLRFIKKINLVTERNPQSGQFFRSTAEIIAERKKQIASKSTIIHPFSTFRLYYEMYMAVIFLICLTFMPLNAAFRPKASGYDAVLLMLDICCVVDIVFTFRTGYKSNSGEEVEMNSRKIAKRYILSIYFTCDVISSFPETKILSPDTNEIIGFLAMAKIARLGTFIKYASRSLHFFKLQGLAYQMSKLVLVTFLVTHFFACAVRLAPYIFDNIRTNDKPLYETYFESLYRGSAILLGIDYQVEDFLSWQTYLTSLLGYFIGKILLTFATVLILNLLADQNSLETKYFSMMSQVDAYMAAKKIPSSIQKRMREYYLYKYRQKYFKETSIKKFMSENLKKEINYHTCRKLVENVQIFDRLPQKVLEDILTFLKVEIYLSSDVIIQAGTLGDCMYFIASGTVSVFSPSGREICHLDDGAYFGEISLVVSGQKRTATVIAIEICELYKLDRKSFKKCLESNKDLYKKLQAEAKRRLNVTQEIESTFMKEFSAKF